MPFLLVTVYSSRNESGGHDVERFETWGRVRKLFDGRDDMIEKIVNRIQYPAEYGIIMIDERAIFNECEGCCWTIINLSKLDGARLDVADNLDEYESSIELSEASSNSSDDDGDEDSDDADDDNANDDNAEDDDKK